ncbi:universal stress protein [Phreatobacter sp.]|uniref:universal stress protein n=1 Tax=Phreatobacter sp. TaxID=1966341 RepID=UPI003F6F58DC
MKIFVASDLTFRSERALSRALELGRQFGGEVTVAHVVDADLADEVRDHALSWAETALKRECQRLVGPGLPKLVVQAVAGKPRRDIIRLAHEARADLMVLGIHDQTRDGAYRFADTTAGHLLKESYLPVLLVREAVEKPYRSVVIGVDFSVCSKRAIRRAVALAPDARITLVHAFQVPFRGRFGSEEFVSEVRYNERLEFDAALAEEMDWLVQRVIATGPQPGAVEKVLREGAPGEVLRAECARIGADLVAVGTHGTTGLTRAIWGSVAEDILNVPPCDVLAVPGL